MSSEDQGKWYEKPNIRKQGTEPCLLYMNESVRLFSFIFVINDNAIFSATADSEEHFSSRYDPEQLSVILFIFKGLQDLYDNANTLLSFKDHQPLMAKLILCRIVDNFLVYMKDLLALIFRTKPETLKSGEQERVDFILQYSTMEDFIFALAEKRVEKLSYKVMRELSDYFKKDLGLELFKSYKDFESAVRLIELRNIIVHNRGIVSNTFKKRLPDYPASVGESIKFDPGTVVDDAVFLSKSVDNIDIRAIDKFSLPCVSLIKEPKQAVS